MNVKLAYGKRGLRIRIPDAYRTDVIEPRWVDGLKDPEGAVTAALRSPVRSRPVAQLARKGMQIGIVFSDITRATPYPVILPALLRELEHVPPEDITFFCATGTHRPASGKELRQILGKEIVDAFRVVQNNASDESRFVHLGNNSSGNEVWLNRDLVSCDLKILTGFIEPHLFMGFSGGGKAIMPGMAGLRTIRFNHSVSMLENDAARWGITHGNPMWEDVREAAERLQGLFLLNVTLNREKEVTGVFAGSLRAAHRAGCSFARRSAMVQVDRPYDLVITSNSGYPLDLNVYQSVKGMSAAAQIVKEGGEILIASECWDGIPEGSDYERILSEAGSVGNIRAYIRENEENLQDTWQVYLQGIIQQKARVSLYSDRLDKHTVRRALLDPVDDPGLLVEEILRKKGRGANICVLPEGPQTIPYLKKMGPNT